MNLSDLEKIKVCRVCKVTEDTKQELKKIIVSNVWKIKGYFLYKEWFVCKKCLKTKFKKDNLQSYSYLKK